MIKLFVLLMAIFISPAQAYDAENSPYQSQWVVRAETYLQNLDKAKSEFDLIAPDETMRSGMFYLNRPGRLRFEYNDNQKDLIVADGTLIHFYDANTNQSQSAPIQSTLANFFLRSNMSFDKDLDVARVEEIDEHVHITLTQKDSPDSGNITLSFGQSPFVLKGWRVAEFNGNVTRMRLKNLETDPELANNLFVFKDPAGRDILNQ